MNDLRHYTVVWHPLNTMQLFHACKIYIHHHQCRTVRAHKKTTLYLPPLSCMCGSPSVHFNSKRDGCSAGIIVHGDRGIAFPAYLPSSHSYWLLGQVSCLTPKEVINQERHGDYHWASSQMLKTHIHFNFVLRPYTWAWLRIKIQQYQQHSFTDFHNKSTMRMWDECAW